MKLSELTLIQVLGIILVINGALSGSVNEMADLLGAGMAKHIVSVATIGSGVCGGLITMFGGLGTQAQNVRNAGTTIDVGPRAPASLATMAVSNDPANNGIQPAPGAGAAVAAIAKTAAGLLLLGLLLLAPDPASAQARKPALTGNIVQDIQNANAKPASGVASTSSIDGALSDFNSKVQQITKDLVDKAIDDVTAAQTDAQNHNDQISKPCWDANLALLKSLPTQWDKPPTFPVGIALGIQIQRDLLNSITGNDTTSLKVACAALWGDQLKIVTALGGLLGIKIATGGLM
jgi:outer membrane murein-binding lipoprotein Lpp